MKSTILALWVLCGGVGSAAVADPAPKEDSTITSDQMELLEHGERVVFTGHVTLSQPPHRIQADQLTQIKTTGVVHAAGHVRGTWQGLSGETVNAQS